MAPVVLQVGGHEVRLTHPAKVLYPETGMTKADVFDYYQRIAPAILPHLRDRPVSLKRFPDGVSGKFFFQKHCPEPRPDWLTTVDVLSERSGDIAYCVLDSEASLLWAANLACLELHAFLHRRQKLQQPTAIVLDLDPGPPANLGDCCRVALLAREELEQIGLKCFAKTSGGKGLHLYVPLNTPVTYEQTKTAAQTLARHFEGKQPDLVTSMMRKELRGGKVFIDWSRRTTPTRPPCAPTQCAPSPSPASPRLWLGMKWRPWANTAGHRDSTCLHTTCWNESSAPAICWPRC